MVEENIDLHSIDKKLAVLIEHCNTNFKVINDKLDKQNGRMCDLDVDIEHIEGMTQTHQARLEVNDERWGWIRGVWVFMSSILVGLIVAITKKYTEG